MNGVQVGRQEFFGYGRTLLLPDGKHLSVTPAELVSRLVNRELISQQAKARHLVLSTQVTAGFESATGNAALGQGIDSREGREQFEKNLELFDLYKQLRAVVTKSVALTRAEREAADVRAASTSDRHVVEDQALDRKRDLNFLAWLKDVRQHSHVEITSPLPAWPS